MATTKKKTGKMSRRQMVMLLGSGVVFAGSVTGEEAMLAADACHDVVPTLTGTGSDGRLLLVADPCCLDGFEAVHSAVNDHPANKSAKGHLKALDTVLNVANQKDLLLEYCVMMWGLTQTQRDAFVKDMKEKYNLAEGKWTPPGKAAKQ